jgi:hypothetical protein
MWKRERALFWRDPEVQEKRKARDAGDAQKPKRCEPQQALRQRPLWRRHQ